MNIVKILRTLFKNTEHLRKNTSDIFREGEIINMVGQYSLKKTPEHQRYLSPISLNKHCRKNEIFHYGLLQ